MGDILITLDMQPFRVATNFAGGVCMDCNRKLYTLNSCTTLVQKTSLQRQATGWYHLCPKCAKSTTLMMMPDMICWDCDKKLEGMPLSLTLRKDDLQYKNYTELRCFCNGDCAAAYLQKGIQRIGDAV